MTGRPASSSPPSRGRRTRMDALREHAESKVSEVVRSHPDDGIAAELQRVLHELSVHQVELEMQNEELNQAQVALESARARYFDLYDHAPVGYVTFNADGLIVEANRMIATMLNLPQQLVPGRRFLDLVAPSGRALFSERYGHLLAMGSPGIFDLQLMRVDKEPLWVQMHMSLLFGADAAAPSCRVAIVDISHSTQLQRKLAHLAAIVESSDDAIIGRDLDGRILSWNEAATQMFGFSPDEMEGGTLDALLPVRRDAEPRWVQRLRRGEGTAHFEGELRTREGTMLPVSLSISPTRDEYNRVAGTSLIARDISQRVAAEQSQFRRLRHLDLLSHTGQALIMGEGAGIEQYTSILDRVRKAIGADIFFHYHLGAEPGNLELVGSAGLTDEQKTLASSLKFGDSLCGRVAQTRERVVVEDLQTAELQEAAALQAAGVRCYAGFPLMAGGKLMGAMAFASTATDHFQEGDLQVIQTVCDQISATLDRAELIRELRNREQQLKEADRKKDDFIATLAHELRNPLAPIHNAVNILRRIGNDNPTERNVLETMSRQVGYMVHLVDDLLEISRVTRGKITLRVERTELGRVLRSAAEISRPLIESGEHEFAMDLPDFELVVDGDPVRLAQVFANLLNNAAKYTHHGGRISVTVRKAAETAVVSVRDNGIGIGPELLPHIFEMFTQGSAGETAQAGLGIGLTLVRNLVDMHGGSVEATSDGPGRGSEFTVRLPLASRESRDASRGRATMDQLTAPCRIVLADDNRDAADSLAYLLRMIGAEVKVVYDGQSALAALDDFNAHVAILDIGMPGLDGYEVARRVREHPRHGDVTLVALTGWGQAEDRQRTRRAGFDYHLVKPADLGDLHRILQSQCS